MKYFAKHVFFLTNLSQGSFLYCPKLFILTKDLNIAGTHTEIKSVALNFDHK